MKRLRLLILMMIAVLFLKGSTVYVRAATASDEVTVKYIYEILNSDGEETKQSSPGEGLTYFVDQTRTTEKDIVAPTVPEGYKFSNVSIESQRCNRSESDSRFIYAGFRDSNRRILLVFNGMDDGTLEHVIRTVTLRIVCTPVQYNVTYDYNGGHGDTPGKSVYFNEKYGTLPVGICEGSTFKGWSLDIDGTKMVYEDTLVKSANNHTLFAQWSGNSYEVSFDANGGSCDVESYTIGYGSKYRLPVATRQGYNFAGWFTEAEDGSQITTETTLTKAAPHTLYAHWTNASYEVRFGGNGGTVSEVKKQITYLGTYGTLPDAERTGYTFTGWYTDKTEGVEITASSKVDIPYTHTLYAGWKANTYSILFDAGGDECKTDKKEVIYASPYGELPSPARTGYSFEGWYLNKDLITEASICYITEQSTLKAAWKPLTFEIAFDPNGGECDTKYKQVTYDELYGELPSPTRIGYTFKGWFLKGELITAETAVTITKDEDLIAKWTPNYYKVIFNANGGECSATEWTYAYDDFYTEFPKAVKDNYIFDGWYTDKDEGVHYTEDMKVSILNDITLYAHWKKIKVIPEDDWYIYPTTPNKNEEKHEITIDEAATKYGYTHEQIRTTMNVYQLTPGVAGAMLKETEVLGADYKTVVTGLDNIEKKRSGKDIQGTSYLQFQPKAKKVTKDSITISWKRIKGAKGYLIYDSECGNTNKFRFDSSTRKNTFTKKKLKSGTYYRFIVVAYSLIDGKQIPIAISSNVHAVTKGGKYGNVKQIIVKKSKKTMKVDKTFAIKAKLKYGKKKKHQTHRRLTYVSTNQKVAIVSNSGVVKAVSKGRCSIYIYDQSGKAKKIRITVRE